MKSPHRDIHPHHHSDLLPHHARGSRAVAIAATDSHTFSSHAKSIKAACICFLMLIFAVAFACQLNAAPQTAGESNVTQEKEKVATFAGGCFWCTEAVFERLDGVGDVISGYIGGHVKNPTYEMVCGKKTGHAEAVAIYYDPNKITYEKLLEVFFKTHDPTTLNKQGYDEGPQYRSSVFYHDEEQKKAAEKYIKKLDEAGEFDRKIVTQLEEATTFYPAEEGHQDFFRKNPNYGYCQRVVAPKVRKVNRNFGDQLKK